MNAESHKYTCCTETEKLAYFWTSRLKASLVMDISSTSQKCPTKGIDAFHVSSEHSLFPMFLALLKYLIQYKKGLG